MTGSPPPAAIEAKIVVLGTQGVGKTSLVHRYVKNSFIPPSKAQSTVGASFLTTRITDTESGTTLRLQIWDTAGQERFRSISKLYYRGAHAAILCYDVTSIQSFEEMGRWLSELREQCGVNGALGDMIIHVVGTKSDVVAADPRQRAVTFEQCIEYVAQQLYAEVTAVSTRPSTAGQRVGSSHAPPTVTIASPVSNRSSGFWATETVWDCCHEVSAKDGEGIDEVFRVVTRKLVEQNSKRQETAEFKAQGRTPGADQHGYFDMPGGATGSFRLGIGDKRRSWLGLSTPGGLTSYASDEGDAHVEGSAGVVRERCCGKAAQRRSEVPVDLGLEEATSAARLMSRCLHECMRHWSFHQRHRCRQVKLYAGLLMGEREQNPQSPTKLGTGIAAEHGLVDITTDTYPSIMVQRVQTGPEWQHMKTYVPDIPPCDRRISWDGTFCHRCRSAFDEWFASPARGPRRNHFLHSVASTPLCAALGCQLCVMILAKLQRTQEVFDALVSSKSVIFLLFTDAGTLQWPWSLSHVQIRITNMSGDKLLYKELRHEALSLHVAPVTSENQVVQSQATQDQPQTTNGNLGHSTASAESFTRIKAWMRACEGHDECRQWPPRRSNYFKPSRLIEITGTMKEPNLRLIRGFQVELGASYMTLSHCWGVVPMTRLTRANADDFRKSIDYNTLPPTFRDAVRVAQELNCRLLWIDALCIIQDDEHDWELEAFMMGDVYSHALVNISAAASIDSRGGLFRMRNVDMLSLLIVCRSVESKERLLLFGDHWQQAIEESPLVSRAWCHQERFLAPRIIHFARDELFWECRHTKTAESRPTQAGSIQELPGTVQKTLLTKDPVVVRTVWYDLVTSYSAANLTFQTDRSVAIVGMARTFAGLLGCKDNDYICGHWRQWLDVELMWFTRSEHANVLPRVSARLRDLPTWSWLSTSLGVHLTVPQASQKSCIVDIVDPGLSSRKSFATSADIMLMIRAPLCEVALCDTLGTDRAVYRIPLPSNDRGQSLGHWSIALDDPVDLDRIKNGRQPLYLMLGRAGFLMGVRPGMSMLDGTVFECLLLEHVRGRPRHFRRVGYVETGSYLVVKALRTAFSDGKVSSDTCGRPDDQCRYHFVLE